MTRRRFVQTRYLFDAPQFRAAVLERAREKGLCQHTLALELGIDASTISYMRHFDRDPQATVVIALAAWAGVDPRAYLVDTEAA